MDVLKPGLVIHSVYNGYWFWGRPSINDLWRDLREATREIRPDWDLNCPRLRAAWEAGDRSQFYSDADVMPNTMEGEGLPWRDERSGARSCCTAPTKGG
jgi:hypothetical protein